MNLIEQTFNKFQQMTRRYALFHGGFLLIFTLELLALLLLMPFFAATFGFAMLVATLFLTFFIYFVLRFYVEIKKPQQFDQLRDEFYAAVTTPKEPTYRLLHVLQNKQLRYTPPIFLQMFAPMIEKFSTWCHWEDVHQMKERLYLHLIKDLFNRIKIDPTDLQLHQELAQTLISLYQIYQPPAGTSYAFLLRRYQAPEIKEQFTKVALSALEELKIVQASDPTHPWPLLQMAQVYRDLENKIEEKNAYETLYQLKPEDDEICYHLGKLYFELGTLFQGLQLYHQLQVKQSPLAAQLIAHYDSYSRLNKK